MQYHFLPSYWMQSCCLTLFFFSCPSHSVCYLSHFLLPIAFFFFSNPSFMLSIPFLCPLSPMSFVFFLLDHFFCCLVFFFVPIMIFYSLSHFFFLWPFLLWFLPSLPALFLFTTCLFGCRYRPSAFETSQILFSFQQDRDLQHINRV